MTRHLTASAVVVNEAGQVLLVLHRLYRAWVPPGGHVDPDESPDEAAIREVREETGLTARIVTPHIPDLPGMVAHPTPWMVMEVDAPAKPTEPAHLHVDYLFVAVAAGEPVHLPAENLGARWFDLADLASLDVRADVPIVALPAVRFALLHGAFAGAT